MRTSEEVLIAMYNRIGRDGWVQGSFRSTTGFCIIGALNKELHKISTNRRFESGLETEVLGVLTAVIDRNRRSRYQSVDIVIEWNDDECKSRRQALAMLDKAIALASNSVSTEPKFLLFKTKKPDIVEPALTIPEEFMTEHEERELICA